MLIHRSAVTSLALAASCAIAMSSQSADAEVIRPEAKAYEQITLRLDEATENENTLTIRVHSRGGELRRAWADSPAGADTSVSHTLKRDGNQIVGDIQAEIDLIEYRYRLQATLRDDQVVGSYKGDWGVVGTAETMEGTIEGRFKDCPEPGEPFHVSLNFYSLYTEWGHIRDPAIECLIRDGQVAEGKFVSRAAGKWGFMGRLQGGTLQFDGDHLRGAFQCQVVDGDATHGVFRFEVDAKVRAGFVEGTSKVIKESNMWGKRPMTGTIWGNEKAQFDNAVYSLTTSEVFGGHALGLYLASRNGTIKGAVARGGNTRSHQMDAGGLDVTADSLTGRIKVDLNPDQGFPPGNRDLRCILDLGAEILNNYVYGPFTGKYGQRNPVNGRLQGSVRQADQ